MGTFKLARRGMQMYYMRDHDELLRILNLMEHHMEQHAILSIARVTHEINRAYCLALGDESQLPWEDAPNWQRASAIEGVKMHLNNPEATPEDSHKSWMAQKVKDGWVYGEVKDGNAKTHPCMVPYIQLPVEQRAKDYIFRGTVHAIAREMVRP